VALTPAIIQGSLLAARASGGVPLNGMSFDKMAMGIANGVIAWAVMQPQNLALTGVAVGTGGVGNVMAPTTKLIVPPNPSLMMGAFTGAGLIGPSGSSLATVVSIGISTAFTSAGQYQGLSPTVGVGSDTSKITVANAASLIGLLNANLNAMMGAGSLIGVLSIGLGNGITSLLLQGFGMGAVTGAPAPYPASGVTLSGVV